MESCSSSRWYITNITRGYYGDLEQRVARANGATGKTVIVHNQPIPDGCLFYNDLYKASSAGDCQSISIAGGYQDLSAWWTAFELATTAAETSSVGTQAEGRSEPKSPTQPEEAGHG